jgi:hypothetical protein
VHPSATYFVVQSLVRIVVGIVLFGSARLMALAIDRMLLQRFARLRALLWTPLPGHGLRKYRERMAQLKRLSRPE